jgi:streptogramin lyase
MRRFWLLGAALLAGCSDALDQGTTAGQAVVVLNQGSRDVTLVDVTRLETTTFPLAPGVPTSLDARGSDLVFALGDSDAVQVATTGGTGGGRVILLAPGSGATGVAIDNDSIAWVASPGLDVVTRFNYRTGDTSSFATGRNPRAVVLTERDVLVVNGNAVGGNPSGPASISWVTRPEGPRGVGTFPLSCTNARFAALGQDGFAYVVCSGTAGAGDGKLAIVDPVARTEVAVLNGLGDAPGNAVYHPSGRLLIASAAEGILEVNTATRSIVRGPGRGVRPANDGVDALLVDTRGRVYAVARRPCTGQGALHVLSAPPGYRLVETIPVGVCPTAAVLAGVPPSD